MKVELWEDVVCSWCGIANERMNRALERFSHRDEVEFAHRSFRLLPELPEGKSVDFVDHMTSRGMTLAQAEQMTARLPGLAREVGLAEYHVIDNEVGNTTLAHEFLAWASDQGKEREGWDLLFRAHFVDREPIWSIEDLVVFAERLGLDPDEARAAMVARTYRRQVEADHNEAVSLGATGVPFLVIDRKYGVPGAQSIDVIVETLEQAWNERAGALQ